MSFCFIVASSDDRAHYLSRCVDCIKRTKYKSADVFLFYQGIDDIPQKEFFRGILTDTNLRGVFTPRYELMKKWGRDYDFVILIDDDLFMYENTSYDTSMAFLDSVKSAGACCISMHSQGIKKEIEKMKDGCDFYNVWGGMVFPKRTIDLVLDYFKDKERDYSEDMFWLLAYVKGYDLYHDWTSSAIHVCNKKGKNGEPTGFRKMRFEKPYVPMMQEWYDSKVIWSKLHNCYTWKIKQIEDLNDAGRIERMKCRKELKFI